MRIMGRFWEEFGEGSDENLEEILKKIPRGFWWQIRNDSDENQFRYGSENNLEKNFDESS